MGLLDCFRYDKLCLFFLILIILLGVFIRLNDFSEVGYWNDDMSTIPTGLLAFYPYSQQIFIPDIGIKTISFPGLSGQGEPILGNLLIGLGCKLSREDFSKVIKVIPMFYPGRPELIGKELIDAFPYCHVPMYLFGILFFLAVSLLSIHLLDKYSSLIAISFYAFYPPLLQLSRWIHVDIFGYSFIAVGLIFLWKAYNYSKGNKEIILFIISFIFFALAFTAKLPNSIFMIFALFILLSKYKKEIYQLIREVGLKLDLDIIKKIQENQNINIKHLFKIIILSVLSYFIIVWGLFYFHLSNIIYVIKRYQSVNPEFSGFLFNTDFLKHIISFLLTINTLDIILFILSLITIVKLIKNKKENNEKFILYLLFLLLFVLIFLKTLVYLRIFIAFLFGWVFIMSMSLSEKYFILSIFKIKSKRWLFFMFLSVYVVYSFSIALSSSPNFEVKNPILCKFSEQGCEIKNLQAYVQKDIANYLSFVMKENETFYFGRDIIYFYIRPEEYFQEYIFNTEFNKQLNRDTTVEERIKFFKFNNRTIRYIVIQAFKTRDEDPFIENLRKDYVPNKVIYSSNKEAVYIYDLENLSPK